MNRCSHSEAATFSMETLHLVYPASSSHYTVLIPISKSFASLPKARSVNVSHLIFVLGRCPTYPLLHNKFVIVPNLYLVLCSVATDQQLAVVVVNRISCYMWTKNWLYRFSLPYIPKMNHWIPTSRNNCVFINELDGKYAVWMSSVVPFGTA